ncbi:MAG: hypothetical protein M1157_01480 [Deinococcus sp.]|nr:hypothetical protein [Deinococcus sp.]
MTDKQKILDMLRGGQLSVQESLNLLEALEFPKSGAPPSPPRPPAGIAKMLRITVDGKDVKVKVNVPVSLAKFAFKFVPLEAREELEEQGIDIAEILDQLKGELPEGRLVDVEVSDASKFGDDGKLSGPMRVVIEVV